MGQLYVEKSKKSGWRNLIRNENLPFDGETFCVFLGKLVLRSMALALQEYLTYKITHPPRTLPWACAQGPEGGPRGVGVFLRAKYSCKTL